MISHNLWNRDLFFIFLGVEGKKNYFFGSSFILEIMFLGWWFVPQPEHPYPKYIWVPPWGLNLSLYSIYGIVLLFKYHFYRYFWFQKPKLPEGGFLWKHQQLNNMSDRKQCFKYGVCETFVKLFCDVRGFKRSSSFGDNITKGFHHWSMFSLFNLFNIVY